MTNSKSTKRALLLSALSVLMCVAMLVGTTFAWFTDTASTAVNKIQSGTLDVALEMAVSYDEDGTPTEWKDAEGETLNFIAKDGREEILWEPGCTYELPTLRIRNNGNLALKYAIQITGINGDAKLNEAIVWTVTSPVGYWGVITSTMAPGFNSWGDVPVLSGESCILKITGHMKEEAGNEYQNLSIDGIGITVVATQYTYEYDSNNNTYDANAQYPAFPWDGKTVADPVLKEDGKYHITNAAQFMGFLKSLDTYGDRFYSAELVLDCDVNLNGATIVTPAGNRQFEGSFDGNDHSVSNFTIDSRANFRSEVGEVIYGGLFGCFGGNASNPNTIKGLTVSDATIIGGELTGAIIGSVTNANCEVIDCHVVNCTVVGTKKVGAVVGYTASGYVKDCSATDCDVYASDTRAEQAGKVIGFINTIDAGEVDNTSGNTATNVNVYTGATPVFVSTADELIASMMTGSLKAHYILTNDIDLGGETVPGFGSNDAPFRGTFNGMGHCISNFKIDRTDREYYAGLFNYVDFAEYDAFAVEIKNLVVRNATVSGPKMVGAVVGGLYRASVKNCVAENCTLTGTKKVGGVVGGSWGTVENCSATGNIITSDVVAESGEIVGYQN